MRSGLKTALFTLFTLAGAPLLVCLLAVAGDRVLGRMMIPPEVRGTLELIFPPGAEQHFRSMEFAYTARINRIGLRERELPSDPRLFRVAAIGDSYTYGWGVEAEDTWLRKTEQYLLDRGYPVFTVNMGKPGSGPPFYAEIAEKGLPIVHPKLVVVGILQGNDLAGAGPEVTLAPVSRIRQWAWTLFPNTMRWIRNARLARLGDARKQETPPQVSSEEDNRRWQENTARDFYEKMTPEEKAKFETIAAEVREAFFRGEFNPYMIDLALKNPQIYMLPMNLEDPWIRQCVKNMADQLIRIRRAAEQEGATVIVLSIPDGPYVNRHALEAISRVGFETDPGLMTARNADEGPRQAAALAGLPFFTVSEGFLAHSEDPDLFFRFDGHLTAKGHALLAELFAPRLESFLRENHLLEPRK
ncbi:MAG TPA: SGNH/GDSL hydrolase family protein [Candidatus Hydrogenedentes bacterium]|nr:SGNH/GDSL hydrolase family protein [Candidatus Hydrogenedentota bacterium]